MPCEPATVPAAVISLYVPGNLATVSSMLTRWEGNLERSKSEDLPLPEIVRE